jgi:hypothetical protein
VKRRAVDANVLQIANGTQEDERLVGDGAGACRIDNVDVRQRFPAGDDRYCVLSRIAGLQTHRVIVVMRRCPRVFVDSGPVMVLGMIVTAIRVDVQR